jgi:hypothetical protein
VRVRDHVALSSTAAVALAPFVGRRVLAPWAASILIDVDHYLWFCLRQRRLNPVAALSFFNDAEVPRHLATRFLHSPLVLLMFPVLGKRWRCALPVTLGMALHVALDVHHEARMAGARAAVLRRDERTCQSCGVRGTRVVAHLRKQPWLLPSYRRENFVTLCGSCHETAHARSQRGISDASRVMTSPGPRPTGHVAGPR